MNEIDWSEIYDLYHLAGERITARELKREPNAWISVNGHVYSIVRKVTQ